MFSSDDISAQLVLLESHTQSLMITLENLQKGSSLVSSISVQCQKLHQLTNSIKCAIQTRFQALKYKENEIQNRLQELEFREYGMGKLSKLQLDEEMIKKGSPLRDLKFIVSTDGERLLMFLNEHENEHEKLADEIYNALKMCNNPGKLVWQAVRGVVLENGNDGIERNVERRSCLVLLEGLMRVGTVIKKSVKSSVAFVAKNWKPMIGVEGEDDMEILLFLMLVSAYDLLGQFKFMEIRSLFERIVHYKQASLLGHILGVVDETPTESCGPLSQQNMEQSKLMSKATDDMAINYSCAHTADLTFIACTDAERLLTLLNERQNDNKIGDDLYDALKVSVNPAKLALNVVKAGSQGKANLGVESGVVKNSFLILLEQLMRLRPEVKQRLRKRALKVAHQWKGNIKAESNNDKEVLVFLMLVGVYGLTSEFNFKEIESLFESVSQYKQAPMLSAILGSVDQTRVRGDHYSGEAMESGAKLEQRIASLSASCWPQLQTFCVSMDARALLLFLSEHVEDHNLMRGEILDAFKLASDPAKLVLDTLPSFYRPKSGYGFKGAALSNARKSCILLLEQLLTCSVQITCHVNEEALKLAVEWKERMEDKYPQGVMAYGFLQFIITYCLTYSYDVDQLLRLLVTASEYRQSPELCLALGLADKISVLIETLIRNNLRLEVVTYICAFDLVQKFPPAKLLNDHLKYSKARMYKKAKNSDVKQDHTIDQEIAILRRVVRCIGDHKLQSLYPPEDLENRIMHLERQKYDKAQKEKQQADKKKTFTVPPTMVEFQQESGLKLPCVNMSAAATPSTSASGACTPHLKPSHVEPSVSLIAHQAASCTLGDYANSSSGTNLFYQQHGCAIGDSRSLEQHTLTGVFDKTAPESIILHAQLTDQSQSGNFQVECCAPSETMSKQHIAYSSTSFGIDLQSYIISMDVRGLLFFLCKHVEDHNLKHSEISDALKLAPDPAKLVLEVLQFFYHSKKKESGDGFDNEALCRVRKSCMLLLEQLRTFLFHIEPHVNEQVLELAADWKERTDKYKKGAMAYGFLQLIVTYGLASGYDAEELFGLLVTASEFKQSPDLCLVLGLADKIRVLIETLINKKLWLEAIAYVCAFDLLDKFPPANMLKEYMDYYAESLYQQAKKSHWKWHQIIDKEIAIVRKATVCISDHKLESLYPPENLKSYISKLEEQKAEWNAAAKAEKQKNAQKKTAQLSSAISKMQQDSGTKSASTTNMSAWSSSAGARSTTRLSPFQLLESFFADQSVPHGL